MTDLWLQRPLDALMQHIPEGSAWVPGCVALLAGVIGIILLLRGARLAQVFCVLGFVGIGLASGTPVAHSLGMPFWATAVALAVVGCAAGFFLFRFWLAIAMGACLAVVSLSVYGVRTAYPRLEDYTSHGYIAERGAVGVTLQEPGAVQTGPGVEAQMGQLWQFLAKEIPGFQLSIWALAISTGLAGVAVGVFLPRITRALLAASAGTILAGMALWAGTTMFVPAAWEWLRGIGAWGWLIVGVVWVGSFLVNYRSVRKKKRKESAAEKDTGPVAPQLARAR